MTQIGSRAAASTRPSAGQHPQHVGGGRAERPPCVIVVTMTRSASLNRPPRAGLDSQPTDGPGRRSQQTVPADSPSRRTGPAGGVRRRVARYSAAWRSISSANLTGSGQSAGAASVKFPPRLLGDRLPRSAPARHDPGPRRDSDLLSSCLAWNRLASTRSPVR